MVLKFISCLRVDNQIATGSAKCHVYAVAPGTVSGSIVLGISLDQNTEAEMAPAMSALKTVLSNPNVYFHNTYMEK